MSVKPPISTHILDTTKGQPAVGVNVMNYSFDYNTFIDIICQLKGFAIQVCRWKLGDDQ